MGLPEPDALYVSCGFGSPFKSTEVALTQSRHQAGDSKGLQFGNKLTLGDRRGKVKERGKDAKIPS
jgi:hypothetical protein